MLKIAPDFTRMIDLPGVGPCPRPVDIDQSATGFEDLVSLRIYSFTGAAPINGEAEGDEVLIVLLDGKASIGVSGEQTAEFELSTVRTRAIYLPPDHHYHLVPDGSATVAYIRAKPRQAMIPHSFDVVGNQLVIEDYADRLQLRLARLETRQTIAVQTRSGLQAERLVHALEGAKGDLDAWQTMALDKGDLLDVNVQGELLIVSAA